MNKRFFCIGGLYQFTFTNIIAKSIGSQYSYYIKAIKQMTSGMSAGDVPLAGLNISVNNREAKSTTCKRKEQIDGSFYDFEFSPSNETSYELDFIPTNAFEYQIVYKLLAHQLWRHAKNEEHAHQYKSCPRYILDIMEIHCRNIVNVFFQKFTYREKKFGT
eukprot:333501_1